MQYSHKKSALLRFSPQKLLAGLGLAIILLISFYNTAALVSPDWNAGFQHPLQGWDHLLTMLAVGIWAAQLRGHAIWMLPLVFVGVMSLGGIAGAAGLAIPSVEGLILLSCAVFSILIVRRARFSTQVNVLIVAFFAFFHGFAHGHEISTSASLISYTFGFMLATLLLHGAGIVVAKLVMLSVTCLVAIFFSNMAQANYAESFTSIKSKNISPVNVNAPGFTRISPRSVISQIDYDEATNNLGNYRSSPDDIPIAIEVPDSSSIQHSKANNIISTYGFSSVYKITSQHHDLALKKATFSAQENLRQDHQLFYSVNIHISSLDFKRYFPDINHTPGKDFLSSGVGLTSPPTILVNPVFLRNTKLFHKTPVSSFEECHLQMTFANVSFGSFSYHKLTSTLGKDYKFRNQLNAGNGVLPPKRYKNPFSIYSTPINFYFHPASSAVGVISSLDFLSVFEKTIKIRNNNTSAIFNKP